MSNKVLAADAGAERERERRERQRDRDRMGAGWREPRGEGSDRWRGSQVELEGLAAPANRPILHQRDLNYIDVPVSFLSNHKQDPPKPHSKGPSRCLKCNS